MFWWIPQKHFMATPDFSQFGSASYYMLRAMEQLIMFSIPAFLFVSGFFVAFALGTQPNSAGWGVVGMRIRTLIIPYVLWSLVIFTWRGLWGSIDTPIGYLKSLLLGRAAPPFYYVPLITQLFLLAPLIVPATRRHWKAVLFASGLLQLGMLLAPYPIAFGFSAPAARWTVDHVSSCFFPHSIFWFVLGVFAGFHLPILKQWLNRWRRVLPWMTIILAILAFVEWEWLLHLSGVDWLAPRFTLLDALYAAAFIFTFMAYERPGLPWAKRFEGLGAASFGIYLIHAPVLELASKAIYHIAPWIFAYQVIFMAILITLGTGIPLLFMSLVNRSPARRCYRYLFG